MAPAAKAARAPTVLGRYVMFDEIAAGGMATVHFGRMRGERGFARTVAIKRLLPQLAADPDFVAMFVDEAKLASRVRHPHVVAPLDIILYGERDLLLVMEYVHGETLARLIRASHLQARPIPPPIAVAIMAGALYGLHAAHEAKSDQGEPLHIVHRDVSPQNVLVGIDGVARVLDFGIAKANMRASITRERTTKGKFSYMSPEQVRQQPIDRRTDVFAAGIVLWEALTGRKLFLADDPQQVMVQIMRSPILPPSRYNPRVTSALNAVVAKALSRQLDRRYPTAWQFAEALEKAVAPATPREVGAWVSETVGEVIAARGRRLAEIEKIAIDEDGALSNLPELAASTPSGPTPGSVSLGSSSSGYLSSAGSHSELPLSGTPLVTAEVVPSILRKPVGPLRRALGVGAGLVTVGVLSLWMLSTGESEAPVPIRVQAGAPRASEPSPPTEAARANERPAAEPASLVPPEVQVPEPAALPDPLVAAPVPDLPDPLAVTPTGLDDSTVPSPPPIGSPERPVVFDPPPVAAPPPADPEASPPGNEARSAPVARPPPEPRARRRRSRPVAPAERAVARAAAAERISPRPRAGVKAAQAPAPCETPYTIDARGIRRIKPECLER